MNVIEEKNRVILEGVKDFEPQHVFDCGQCFRWIRQEDGSYTGVVQGRVINVKKEGDNIILDNTNKKDFEEIWYDYFDLGRDYTAIKNELKVMDEYLDKATEFGQGIRILRQDGHEQGIALHLCRYLLIISGGFCSFQCRSLEFFLLNLCLFFLILL